VAVAFSTGGAHLLPIDLHAAPGKQNNDDHAGAPGPAQFFKHKANMQHTLHVLTVLLQHLTSFTREHGLANLVGLELLNEPAPEDQHGALEGWYKEATQALRAIDPGLPLILGDCWWTDHYAEYIAKAGQSALVLDHHLYRCFTSEDGRTPAVAHAQALGDANSGAPTMLRGAADKLADAGGALIVGEWSGALNPGSVPGGGDHVDERRAFVQAELDLFERVCAGWYFWTYKKEGGRDLGWCWRDAVEAGVFPTPVGMVARSGANVSDDAGRTGRRDQVMQRALSTSAMTLQDALLTIVCR
jgi:glucan 1,3-beta-glucosidase